MPSCSLAVREDHISWFQLGNGDGCASFRDKLDGLGVLKQRLDRRTVHVSLNQNERAPLNLYAADHA